MNRFLILPLLASLIFACQTQPPNVLLVLTDDQGYGDIHLHGNDSIDTPAMDRLATEGIRLDRFYVSPVCAPTRASLLTGRYHLRTGAWWVTRGWENMNLNETTLADIFRANGYATACFGKWHNGAHYPYSPRGRGFDEFTGFSAGHWTNYFDTHLQQGDSLIQTEGYISDVLTDYALAFIRKNKQQPFFCYVPYNAPHSPFQVPDQYFDKYKKKGLTDKNAAVYGMVENLDDNLSRLLGTLREEGLEDNTIVLFITDNGPNGNRYNGGMRGRKAQLHEGGTRVPCFIKWPGGLPGGRTLTELSAHIDILPTLAELCELTVMPETRPLDGISLATLLRGQADSLQERSLFTHHCHRTESNPYPGAMRSERYRYVAKSDTDHALYDMQEDPAETTNLASEKPSIMAEMAATYLSWYQEVAAEGKKVPPLPVGYPEAHRVILPAHEAVLGEGLAYKADPNGWAHDWIINWHNGGRIFWELEVRQAGEFYVRPQYASQSMVTFRLDANGTELLSMPVKAMPSRDLPSPDRVARKAEAFEKNWGSFPMGKISLPAGKVQLGLHVVKVGEGDSLALKGLILESAQ